MTVIRGPLKNLVIVVASALAVFLLVVIGLVWANRSPVSSEIRRQISFSVFYPRGSDVKIETDTFKYDSTSKQLSFIVQYKHHSITFAEQATPDQFNDIPEYYDKFTEKMRSYATFENDIGKVSLTRPVEVKNQVAVMNNKGVLLFAQTNGDMSEDDWRGLFNDGKYGD